MILVATGYHAPNKCQVVDVSSSSTACSDLPSYPLSPHKAVGGVLKGTPIICGGHSGSSQQICYWFEKNTNSWKFHSNMKTKRDSHASTALKNSLFITGGTSRDANGILASSEYVYANGTVESGPDMPVARYGHCMVTLHDGKVMIVGADEPYSQIKNVMIYDAFDNSYTNGPSLIHGRRFAGCALFNSALHNGRPVVLAAGGYDATAEVFDYTYANHWQTSIHLIISNL